MSINRKTMLILSFVCAVMIFNIDVIHCCSTTPNATKANTMDWNLETSLKGLPQKSIGGYIQPNL